MRPVTPAILGIGKERLTSLNQKICTNCLKDLNKLITKESSSSSSDEAIPGTSTAEAHQIEPYEEAAALESVNVSLALTGESPIEKKRMKRCAIYYYFPFSKFTFPFPFAGQEVMVDISLNRHNQQLPGNFKWFLHMILAVQLALIKMILKQKKKNLNMPNGAEK